MRRLTLGIRARRLVVASLILAALGMGAGVATAGGASAAGPPTAHGTCGLGDGVNGASGCAGNVGGFVITKAGVVCFNDGPFSDFFCPSP
jgi:hypothetical protein